MSPEEDGSSDKEKATPFEPRELLAAENLARTEALGLLGWAREAPGEAKGARRAAVFAGRASAGAVALAVARHLANYGVECRTLVCGPEHRLSPLLSAELAILEAMGQRAEESAPPAVSAVVGGLGPDDALVDGAGEANAPGREEEFASACRSCESAGRIVRLSPTPDSRPPAPTPEDVLFSPDAEARSREDVRLFDSIAIERYRIPGLVLMENAGWRVAREAYAMLGFRENAKVVILAGAGNNGGDGFVAARHLVGWGVGVEAVLVGAREGLLDDARANLALAEEAGVEVRDVVLPGELGGKAGAVPELVAKVVGEVLEDAALVVDALLGTGLSGKVRGAVVPAIEIVNDSGARVLAVDTPSGLDANTGEVLGIATRAERTVTFAFPKLGFSRGEGAERAGEVVVADISMPRALWAKSRGP